jgi:hypothetical protein
MLQTEPSWVLQLQRTAGNQAVAQLLQGDGKPLDPATRVSMEARLDHDLSSVRVHSDETAAQLARQVDALAFTVGDDVVLGADAPPHTRQGQRLLAHELAHVVQGDQRGPGTPLEISHPGDDAEREADHAAARISAGGMAPALGHRGPKLYRKPQRPAPASAASVQQKYGITITTGDKAWSADDLKALDWTLSKLSKQELQALKGYDFLRWSDAATRAEKDPAYTPQAEEECGLHEADIAKGSYKISMYDKCFKDPEATSHTMAGVSIERFHMLHEIGHAMEAAELRRTYEASSKATDAFNAAVDEHNAQNSKGASTAQLKKLEKKADALDKLAEAADKRYKAAQGRTIADFEKRVAGAEALTEYSKAGAGEAFAEAFALYKADPKGLKKANPSLYDWFARHGHLNPLTSPPRPKGKPR